MELYKIVSGLMIDIEKIRKMSGEEKKELLFKKLDIIYPNYDKDTVEIIIDCVIFLSYNKNIIKHINKTCKCGL